MTSTLETQLDKLQRFTVELSTQLLELKEENIAIRSKLATMQSTLDRDKQDQWKFISDTMGTFNKKKRRG